MFALFLVAISVGLDKPRRCGGHWSGGVVLGLVGTYAIASETLGRHAKSERPHALSLVTLVLGATLSIDNPAIGFALGNHRVGVAMAALVIAMFSVALTLVGLDVGARLGQRLRQGSELVGGLMLVGIGVAIGTGLL